MWTDVASQCTHTYINIAFNVSDIQAYVASYVAVVELTSDNDNDTPAASGFFSRSAPRCPETPPGLLQRTTRQI